MGMLGFGRKERQAVPDPVAGQVYVERRPGESSEAFEARLAAAARERALPPGARRTVAEPRPALRRDHRHPEDARPVRRRGHGGASLLGFMVVLIAAVGVLWMVLAAREGSFAAGGAVVDRKLAEFTSPARVAANQAVDRTGQAVQNAGQTIEYQGERLRQTAQ